MERFPPAGPNPYDRDDAPIKVAILRMKMLSALATDYAKSVERLVKSDLEQDDPYKGGNSDALLAVVAARDVHRIAIAVRENEEIPEFLADSIRSKTDAFEVTHPHLKTTRDVIQHADAYISSDGKLKDHWFDITKRFGPKEFHLRISSHLDIDMVKLATDASGLAAHVDNTVNIWTGIELKFSKANKFAQDLVDQGFSADIEIMDDYLDLRKVERKSNTEEATVTVSFRI